MSILLCTTCDTHFDSDIHVEAEYFPSNKCEECVFEELEKKHPEWSGYLKEQKYGN